MTIIMEGSKRILIPNSIKIGESLSWNHLIFKNETNIF